MRDANDINIVLKILRNHGENRKQLYLEEAQGVSNGNVIVSNDLEEI